MNSTSYRSRVDCTCGGVMTVTSDRQSIVDRAVGLFRTVHQGPGHRVENVGVEPKREDKEEDSR